MGLTLNLFLKKNFNNRNFMSNKLKTNFIFDVLIFLFGLFGYMSGYYLTTVYAFIHFLLTLAKYLSKTVNERLENFKKDHVIIKHHYLKDFQFFYYSIFTVQLISFLFLFFFFSLNPKDMNCYSNLFYFIIYSYIIITSVDLFITIFIILNYKTGDPIKEITFNIFYHIIHKGSPIFFSLHLSAYMDFISPNLISNAYHKYTVFGRGYGVWSSEQLLLVDYLKTRMGGSFDYREIVDDNKMVDSAKLDYYIKKCDFSFDFS